MVHTKPMARKVQLNHVRAHGCMDASSALLMLAAAAAVTATTGFNQAVPDRLLFIGPSSLPCAPALGARAPRNARGLESDSVVRMQRSRWCGRDMVGKSQRQKRCFRALSMASSSEGDVSEAGGAGLSVGGCIAYESLVG